MFCESVGWRPRLSPAMTPWIPVLLASMVNVLFDVAVAATAVSNVTEALFAGTGLSKVIVKLLTPWIGKLPRTPCNVRNDWGGEVREMSMKGRTWTNPSASPGWWTAGSPR